MNVSTIGLPGAVVVMVTVAERPPDAVGMNVAVIVQLLDAPDVVSCVPFAHAPAPPTRAKSPGLAPPRTEMVLIVAPAKPVFESVEELCALVVPTF